MKVRKYVESVHVDLLFQFLCKAVSVSLASSGDFVPHQW